jgi:hypothetical protein
MREQRSVNVAHALWLLVFTEIAEGIGQLAHPLLQGLLAFPFVLFRGFGLQASKGAFHQIAGLGHF